MVAKFITNSKGVLWWLNLQQMHVAAWRHLLTKFASYKVPLVMVSTHGSVVPLAMFFNFLTLRLYQYQVFHINRLDHVPCLSLSSLILSYFSFQEE